jgi:hypothetical protein
MLLLGYIIHILSQPFFALNFLMLRGEEAKTNFIILALK